jgi:integrase
VSEAKRWRAQAVAEAGRGRLRAGRRLTVREAAEAFLEGAAKGTITKKGGEPYKPSTTSSYERVLRERVLPRFGNARLDKVTRNDLEDFAAELAEEQLDGSTIANILMPVRTIFRRAVRRSEVAVNPTTGLELPAPRRKQRPTATPADLQRFLAHLETPLDLALWGVAYYTGLRLGEILALRWEDLDLASGWLRVERAWDSGARVYGKPKTAASRRGLPIPSVLRDYLLEHKAAAAPNELVFPSPRRDGPIAPSTVWRRGRAAAESAGVPWVSPHGARHSYATQLHDDGLDDFTLTQFMGHSSIVVTKDVYTTLTEEARRAAAERVDRLFS